ncbi:glycosyltransferase [Clostridium akagii]|uniref:glycosyltransferase n=1 Tax=Clostridium akagii TaxID=91623 RepID=UPI00047E4053|nr:glycosyltransferase [Clostridium akagii]
MKLGFIINKITTGGAEKQTVELINNLANRDFDITLYILKDGSHLDDALSSKIKTYNIGVKKYLDFNGIKKLKLLISEEKINILFTVSSYSCLYGYFATLKTNIIRIWINHTTVLPTMKDKIKNIYYKKIINKMDYRIFVSLNQKNYWVKKYKISNENSIVIHNGIDNSFFNPELFKDYNLEQLRLRFCVSDKNFVILFCAMFRPEKNHLELLCAIKKLIDRNYTNIKLILVGDGIEKGNIAKYIKENKLGKYIYLEGLQKDVRMYSLISDIGVLSSKSVETFSLAALEQLAMGVPMIMSNIGGANEMIIDGYNGFLYNSKDIDKLVNIIEQCYLNKNKLRKMKTNAKKVVSTKFTTQFMVEKYISVLDSILDKN